MRRIVLLLIFVGVTRVSAAQQPVDLYSIPAKSTYSLQSFVGKRPLTRAERTNFAETSHYDDVIAFIDSLKLLGAKIATGSIGKTSEGRELPYVIASRPLVSTPAAARQLHRPIAYIQANIHAGEVEGKEAMLSMLRDLVFDKKKNVLDSIVLIVQPIYNADGNEKWGPQAKNRGSQNGPELVGTRQNASGWNLNRDYIGADAPETRGSLAMLNKWNPDLFMDLHTTDGSVHGYALTYSPSLAPAAVNVIPYTTTMLAEIRRRMLDREGFYVQDYGDFSRPRPDGRGAAPGGALGGGGFGRGDSTARGRRGGAGGGGGGGGFNRGPSLEQIIADSIPTSGWVFSTYEPFARYGTNYYGLRNRVAILSEAFSHDPFARRVASTYDFVSEILSYVAANGHAIMQIGPAGDALVHRVGVGHNAVAKVVAQVAHGHDAHRRRPRGRGGSAHRQHEARSGARQSPTHWNHQAGAHAGDGELHTDAHEHAAVRVRVRLGDSEGDSPDPRRARHRRRSTRRARDRHRPVVCGGQRD